MKTLYIFVGFLLMLFFIYLLSNMFVLLGSVLVLNFHPRAIIEKKAYDWLFANRRRKFDVIEKAATEHDYTPLEIAHVFGGRNVILGCVYLLAANHMKKTGVLP